MIINQFNSCVCVCVLVTALFSGTLCTHFLRLENLLRRCPGKRDYIITASSLLGFIRIYFVLSFYFFKLILEKEK